MSQPTFSESWHRVASAKLALRPSVGIRRVYFRGERWHVLSDPLSNQYFRVRPGAYDIIARLDGKKTVAECWEESLAQSPAEAPGQEEIIQLLAQLYKSNLLRGDLAPDSAKLFERFKKRRTREVKSKLMSILFIRIPLIDPDAFLVRSLAAASWLFTRFGALLWLAVIGLAAKVVIENASLLWAQSQSVLSPGNLPLLYLAMIAIKLIHELGHGYACRKFGGEVHTLGVMLLIFTPMPFVDATSSWNFPNRNRRIIVAAAGMIVELLIAAIAVFVWAATGPGIVHSLAYNIIFIASVSTILFNANPLLRFDGYYILCDLIGIPNLHRRAGRMWRHLAESRLFGYRRSVSPAESRREAAQLLTFGAAAWVYRIFLYAGIILFVADQFLLLGAVMAAIAIVTWVIVPVFKLAKYLASSPRLDRRRARATSIVLGATSALIAALAIIPFPRSFAAPGIVRSENYAQIFLGAPGRLVRIVTPSGSQVESGDVLLEFENRELQLQLAAAKAELTQIDALNRKALNQPGDGLKGILERAAATRDRIARLESDLDSLKLRAPNPGIWIAENAEQLNGVWLPRGATIGEIVDPSDFRFSAVVSQEDAAFLFDRTIRTTTVRLRGQALHDLSATDPAIIPASQKRLPSAVLGWAGGGDIATDQNSDGENVAAEGFYELRASLPQTSDRALRHGLSGKLRCQLPPSPLLQRGIRSARQLLQRRFGI